MTTNEPILERVKRLIPSLNDITETFQLEHDAAKRIHKLMLLSNAALIDLSERVSQAVADSGDLIETQADVISGQAASMKEMTRLAVKQADARTVIQNQDIMLSLDPVSIQHILEIVELPEMTTAARNLSLYRLAAIVDALLNVTEE